MTQFGALYKKNFLYWSKNWCGSLCEILAPLIFAAILCAIRALTDEETQAATTFLSEPITNRGSLKSYSPTPNITAPFPANYVQYYIQHALLNRGRYTLFKNCTYNDTFSLGRKGGKIALGPVGNPIALNIERLINSLGYKAAWYNSIAEINEWT
jgi:ATP-binding cassette, subfamily A (ABC1), member 3